MVVDQVDSVMELVAGAGTGTALEAAIGEDAADRIRHGAATLCDVVLTSWVIGIDSTEAVVEYATAVLESTLEEGNSRCASAGAPIG